MTIKLREFGISDAAEVAQLAGDEAVSKWTSNIPFPYSEHDAIDWINQTRSDPSKNTFAVVLDGPLVACVSYWPYERGGVEVGYWVGKEFWGKGVCTEALKLLLANKRFPAGADVFARVMVQNIGSQRVLEKYGFSFLRKDVIRKGGGEIQAKIYVLLAATRQCQTHLPLGQDVASWH